MYIILVQLIQRGKQRFTVEECLVSFGYILFLHGGYLSDVATSAYGGGHNKVPIEGSNLTAEVLLEKMNAAASNQQYIDTMDSMEFSKWKIDTNISSTYPVLEWE